MRDRAPATGRPAGGHLGTQQAVDGGTRRERAPRAHVGGRYRLAAHGQPRQRDDDRQRHDDRHARARRRAAAGDRDTLALLPAVPPAAGAGCAGRVLAGGHRVRPGPAPRADGAACPGRPARAGSAGRPAGQRPARSLAPAVAGAFRAALRSRQCLDPAAASLLCGRHGAAAGAAVAERAGRRSGAGGPVAGASAAGRRPAWRAVAVAVRLAGGPGPTHG